MHETYRHPLRRGLGRVVVAVCALGVVFAATACGGDDETVGTGTPGEPGDGTTSTGPFGDATWELVGGSVDGVALVADPEHPVTLEVDDGQVGGTSACNRYGGPVDVDDTRVAFGSLFATEMWCGAPGVMDLEATYLDALARVDTATAGADTLVLVGEGVELRFAARAPVPDADLAGTPWRLESLIEGESVSSTVAGAAADLLIGPDGAVSGSGGCNRLIGSLELVDGRLEGLVGSTSMACAPAVMAQEDRVLAVLSGSPTVTIEGERLTLELADGTGLVYLAEESSSR